MDFPRHDEIALTDAALRLEMPYPLAYRAMFTGQLHGRRIGARLYVRRADVEKLAAEQSARIPQSA